MLASIKKNGWILGAFAALTTAIVATTHHFTAPAIAEQTQRQVLRTLNELIVIDSHNNDLFADCTVIVDEPMLGNIQEHSIYRARKDGEPVAVAMEVNAPDGYNGRIQYIVVVDANDTVLGVRTIKHNETPGLGDKIELRKSDWINSFAGMNVESEQDPRWKVKKDGGNFDQFTGATITPRATVNAVLKSVNYFKQNKAEIFALPANCEAT